MAQAAGVAYYLEPDFSKITPRLLLDAMSQAFFSLCVGEGVLMTYGSYAKKSENLLSTAGYIALFDTAVALLSGLIIFPAAAVFNVQTERGVGMIYNIMPKLFLQLGLGTLLGFLFFFCSLLQL